MYYKQVSTQAWKSVKKPLEFNIIYNVLQYVLDHGGTGEVNCGRFRGTQCRVLR
jgi:hypothetical protein